MIFEVGAWLLASVNFRMIHTLNISGILVSLLSHYFAIQMKPVMPCAFFAAIRFISEFRWKPLSITASGRFIKRLYWDILAWNIAKPFVTRYSWNITLWCRLNSPRQIRCTRMLLIKIDFTWHFSLIKLVRMREVKRVVPALHFEREKTTWSSLFSQILSLVREGCESMLNEERHTRISFFLSVSWCP